MRLITSYCHRPNKAWSGVGATIGMLAMVVAGSAWGQGAADVEQPEALIKAAKAEGGLMLYSSSDESQSKALLAAFGKKYGINGTYIRFPTGPLMQRFNTEYDAKNVQADLLSVSSPIPYDTRPEQFAAVSRETVPNLGKWPSQWVKKNHFTWTTEIISLAYNTDLVKQADVPKTWGELADPKWKGKFLLTDPQVADNYLGWLDAVERSLGVAYLRKLSGQDYKVTQSGASGAQMVAAGAHVFNAPTFPAFSNRLIAKKAPIAIQYMSGPTIVSPRDIAIVSGASHPNTARLFLNWLISDEGIRLTCAIGPTSVVGDEEGKLGCVPVRNGEAMRFDVSAERKQMLAKEIGVAR